MMGYMNKSLKLSALCVAIACVHTSAFALENLEQLDDYELADSTGEGIAFLPENTVFLLRGAGAGTTESISTLLNDRSNDTGYINYIPVGPLTNQAATSGAGKADLYLYGLAISKGNGDLNSRLSATDPMIRSWGTAANPWLFKVETETGLPNFASTGTDSVTYLALEAPLHHLYTLDYTGTANDVTNNIPTTGEAGADAYNLKLGLWADAFVLDPRKSATDTTRYQYNPAAPNTPAPNRENRLRLQAIWDGLSINGSDIKLFQTMGGATSTATSGNAKDTSYNHTLGLAGILRFNSGDTRALKASYTNGTVTRTMTTTNRYSTTYLGRPGGSGGAHTDPANLYRLRTLDTRDDYTASSWTMPSLNNIGVLRLSTQECGSGNLNGCTTGTVQGVLTSPAVSGDPAPNFSPTEGVHLYGANINLVLGSLYQPLILNKDQNSNNLVLEIAAIPNKVDIYKKIYTDYRTTGKDATYLGSTCSVYFCGTPIEVNGVKTYQGNTATHSSISIGTTEYNPDTGLMTAFKGTTSQDSIGVSFGALASSSTAAHSRYYYQLQQQSRARGGNDNRWSYNGSNGTNDCTVSNTTSNSCYQFNTVGGNTWTNISSFNQPTIVSEYNPTIAHTGYVAASSSINNNQKFAVGYSCSGHNCTTHGNLAAANWGPLPTWDPVTGSGANFSGTTWTSNPAPTYQSTVSSSPSNNLGSAVIDGLLIQHMKITTKGL